MDNRLKQIYDNFDRLKIGLDEEFKFNCTMCGKCCINREDILLNPKDMFNLAKELNMEAKQVLEAYCETYIGSDSRFPIVRLKPKGSIKRCPLLAVILQKHIPFESGFGNSIWSLRMNFSLNGTGYWSDIL